MAERLHTNRLSGRLADSVDQTRDKGYIVAGSALSFLGVTSYDAWLLRLDRRGNVEWSKTYGGPADDGFGSVQQTSDSGYIVAGATGSFGPGVQYSGITGWVFKLDSRGSVVWEKDFGADEADSVQQTRDGGFIVTGTGGLDNNGVAWVFKLDSKGNTVWQKAFETTRPFYIDDRAHWVRQTSEGGYIVVAESITIGRVYNFEYSDSWVLRLDADGNLLWQKLYSGGGFTDPSSVTETSDGGFAVAGRARPRSSGIGMDGPFLFKLDAHGNLQWQKLYGGLSDFFYQVEETKDRGLVVVGSLFGTGAWVLKLDADGSIQGCLRGTPANATISDAAAVPIDTTVASVNIDATVVDTGAIALVAPAAMLTQCVGTVQADARDDDELSA